MSFHDGLPDGLRCCRKPGRCQRVSLINCRHTETMRRMFVWRNKYSGQENQARTPSANCFAPVPYLLLRMGMRKAWGNAVGTRIDQVVSIIGMNAGSAAETLRATYRTA